MAIQDTNLSESLRGYGSFAMLTDRPVLILRAQTGPAQGETFRFDQSRILVGRGPDNDLRLDDPGLSIIHGEFFRSDEGFLYRDLAGDNHSRLIQNNEEIRLCPQKPYLLAVDARIVLGLSEVAVEVDRVFHSQQEAGPFRVKLTQKETGQFLATRKAEQQPSTHSDSRMGIMADLASKLNKINILEEIVEHLTIAAFATFKPGYLFSINLLEGENLRPIAIRVRELGDNAPPEVVLSRTVLSRVVETEEAVLYVQGGLGGNPSNSFITANISSCICAPLIGHRGLLGVIHMDTRENGGRFTRSDLDLFCVLASHTAFAIERTNLLDSIYRMFERFVEASVAAIEARDPSTAGHSERVAKYSLSMAESINRQTSGPFADLFFSPLELTELRYAALLHDFGKVGVRESVLMKGERLSADRMAQIGWRLKMIGTFNKEQLTRRFLEKMAAANKAPTLAELADLDQQAAAFQRLLEQERLFIDGIRRKWSLQEEEIERIRSFGSRTAQTENRQVIPFLTAEEIENLTIPVGTLNEQEWLDMRSHVSKSEDYLRMIPWNEDLAQVPCIAGAHHERLDGSGYPRGLLGDDISPRVRILIIADIFDAVTAWDRPYTLPYTLDDAIGILKNKAEIGRIDADMVNLFLEDVLPRVIHIVPQS